MPLHNLRLPVRLGASFALILSLVAAMAGIGAYQFLRIDSLNDRQSAASNVAALVGDWQSESTLNLQRAVVLTKGGNNSTLNTLLTDPMKANDEARSVALSTAACSALRELQSVRRLDGRIFDWTDPHSVARPFRRCVTRATELYQADCLTHGSKPAKGFLEDLRFHDIRHEATSRLFEKGLNPMEVASMTGHKSMQMLKRYTHVEAAKVAAKLG